ncbi:MAG: HPr family phosphocarrier protein [bacterium]|nr:HPr family phosphocarrier protein [bacterium]
MEGNAKSVLSVLSVCANAGDEIEIICDGRDERAALRAIVDMFESIK